RAHRARAEALLKLALLRGPAQRRRLREDYQAAVDSLTRYLRQGAAPWDPLNDVYRWRGFARQQLGGARGALEDYNQAIKLKPADAALYLYRGWAYYFNKAWDLARDDFRDALKRDSSLGDAYNGLGNALVMIPKSDTQQAIEAAEKAYQLKPN